MLFKVCIYVFSLLVICESAFVDSIFKCSKDDADCHTKLIKTVLVTIGADGIPEYDIAPVDPMHLQNFKLSLLDVDITLVDGVLKGVKKCTINKFTPNLEARVAKLDITCDIIAKGKYKVFSASPLIKSFLGGSEIHGEGDGRVKMQKLRLNLEFPFKVVKRGKDIFLAPRKELTFTFDVGNVVFSANKLYLGETESSDIIVKLLNQNWKIIIETFGKDVMKEAMVEMQKVLTNFYSKVPAQLYFIDDLTPYVED